VKPAVVSDDEAPDRGDAHPVGEHAREPECDQRLAAAPLGQEAGGAEAQLEAHEAVLVAGDGDRGDGAGESGDGCEQVAAAVPALTKPRPHPHLDERVNHGQDPERSGRRRHHPQRQLEPDQQEEQHHGRPVAEPVEARVARLAGRRPGGHHPRAQREWVGHLVYPADYAMGQRQQRDQQYPEQDQGSVERRRLAAECPDNDQVQHHQDGDGLERDHDRPRHARPRPVGRRRPRGQQVDQPKGRGHHCHRRHQHGGQRHRQVKAADEDMG